MAKLNMVKVNTLIRKVYLLAGVIMAANMFAVNEVRATDKNSNFEANELINPGKKDEGKKTLFLENVLNYVDWVSYHVLSYENTINLVGGVVFSCGNNYLKLWDYNPGKYSKLGCFGWRSGRLIKDIFQVDININLGRGILWLIPGTYNYIKAYAKKEEDYIRLLHFSYLVAERVYEFFTAKKLAFKTTLIGFFLLQGFVSVPLAIHISNFSIAVSLDSMLWAGIGKFLDKGKNNGKGGIKGEEELKGNRK